MLNTNRVAVKFMNQQMLIIDTNAAVYEDPYLYDLCASIPDDLGTVPVLQAVASGDGALLIRASHFDYSADGRDFVLAVCDSPDKPLYKDVSLSGASNQQDGWLVQGRVSNFAITDPMFLLVTNMAHDCNAFLWAIPYGGPEVTLTGFQPYDVASNTIALHVSVSDLSGTTNQQLTLLVDGAETPYTLGASNTVQVDTHYLPNGVGTIYATVGSDNAQVCNPTNQPMDMKLVYESTATLSLDFENPTFLASSGDDANPDEIGTNYIVFGVTPPQYVRAVITDTASGRVLKNVSGYDASQPYVSVDWSFTEVDGVTPYTGDQYTVSFTASAAPTYTNPTKIKKTNMVSKSSVRVAGWQISSYEEIKPSDYNGLGATINSESVRWGRASGYMYETIYYWGYASQTGYYSYQIGNNRANPLSPSMPISLTPANQLSWPTNIMNVVTNRSYSDFNYNGHGHGYKIGGGEYEYAWRNYINTTIDTGQMAAWVRAGAGKRFKMRKVALWACYTYRITQGISVGDWPNAFSISPVSKQIRGRERKNAGLFFYGDLRWWPYGAATMAATDVAEVISTCETLWVGGPFPAPGSADPLFCYGWALQQIGGLYPEINNAKPVLVGFPLLPYGGGGDYAGQTVDDSLMINDWSMVKTQ